LRNNSVNGDVFIDRPVLMNSCFSLSYAGCSQLSFAYTNEMHMQCGPKSRYMFLLLKRDNRQTMHRQITYSVM